MVVWTQDGLGVTYFDRIAYFHAEYREDTDSWLIMSGDVVIGEVSLESEARRVLVRVVACFAQGLVECNPW